MNPTATAQRLINRHGGNVTLRKYARTAGAPSTPWRGPGGTLADSRTEKSVILTREQAQAARLPVTLGSMQALVAPPLDNVDISGHDELLNGTRLWKIVGCNPVMYQGITVLYIFGLEQ